MTDTGLIKINELYTKSDLPDRPDYPEQNQFSGQDEKGYLMVEGKCHE